MQDQLETFSQRVNFARYRGQPEGHYDSFFLRANHLERPETLDLVHDLQSQGAHS